MTYRFMMTLSHFDFLLKLLSLHMMTSLIMKQVLLVILHPFILYYINYIIHKVEKEIEYFSCYNSFESQQQLAVNKDSILIKPHQLLTKIFE